MDIDLARLRTFFAAAPFMADLGVEPFECEPGRVATRLELQPRHHQHSIRRFSMKSFLSRCAMVSIGLTGCSGAGVRC